MTNPRKFYQSGIRWLLFAWVLCGAGLFCGFLGMLGPGIGVSGSGCGTECLRLSACFMGVGMTFVVLAVGAAMAATFCAWKYRGAPLPRMRDVILSGAGLLTVLVAIALLFLLKAVL